MKTFLVSNYQRIKNFYGRYERVLMSGSLVAGFLFDFIAFVNIDLVVKFTILLVYWVCAGGAIAFMQIYDSHFAKASRDEAGKISRQLEYVRLFMPLVLQWTFGGLLNISLIFYWFSGAFSVSWPVLGILVLLLLCNEAFRHQFSKPLVQISVYFFTTLSLFSLVLPFAFASLSPWLFVAAGALSFAIFTVYILGLAVLTGRAETETRKFFAAIFLIAVVMNVLYFTNIIPPIPLALREAGLYHSLLVTGDKYILGAEPETFWQQIQDALFGQTVHVAPGQKVYLYTSIFAPSNLQTVIVDRWQYYDEAKKTWVDEGNLSFTINGGRKAGYKGYSWEQNLAAGNWQVYVQNQRGQVLAKVRFKAVRVTTPVNLETITK